MLNLCKLSYTDLEIQAKRLEVAQRLILLSANIKEFTRITRIAPDDLKFLFDLYDEIFLEHQFRKSFQDKLKFSLSSRLSKAAGKTLYPKNMDQLRPGERIIEIRIGTAFLFKYHEIEGDKSVGGIATHTALQALQLVFEHEICHVIEFINFKTSSCKQARFKSLAGNLFGHTESCHKLPTVRQIVQQNYGLKIGDNVIFYYGNQKFEGILYRINQRATVMVRSQHGTHADNRGNRYDKYYVPIEHLQR